MPRRRMTLAEYAEWRKRHFGDGTPREDDELSWLMVNLLSTRSGARAMLRTDRREAKKLRPQHTASPCKNADYPHQDYGRRRGRWPR